MPGTSHPIPTDSQPAAPGYIPYSLHFRIWSSLSLSLFSLLFPLLFRLDMGKNMLDMGKNMLRECRRHQARYSRPCSNSFWHSKINCKTDWSNSECESNRRHLPKIHPQMKQHLGRVLSPKLELELELELKLGPDAITNNAYADAAAATGLALMKTGFVVEKAAVTSSVG